MTLSLRYAARSHVGLIRDGNEDSGYAGPRLLAVADGMGGQAAGELASSVVVQTLAQLDVLALAQPPSDPVSALAERIDEAHDRLHSIITENPQLEGMGTTLTAFLFSEDLVAFAHIGDSRAYRLRGGRLEQLTADHTWVQRLVDEGRISEEEAGHHPQRSLLMRALDGRGQVADADLSLTDVQPGDRLMLCSDGLSSFVSFDTLESTLAAYAEPHQAAESLIQLALRAGGPDNVTCIVADVLSPAFRGPKGSANSETQSVDTPMTVGAAAEHGGGAGLSSFESPTGQPPASGNMARSADAIPTDTPAGRAAWLRRAGRRGENPAEETEGPAVADWSPDPKKRRWRKPAIGLAAVVVVVGGLGGGAYYWTQQQYYVASDNGHVAIYRGVDGSIAGIHLSHVYSTTPQIAISSLPTASQNRVRDSIAATSLADAQSILQTLSALQTDCAALTAAPSPGTPIDGQALSSTAGAADPSPSPRVTATGSAKARAPIGASASRLPGAATIGASATSAATAAASPSASIAESNQLSAQCPGASGTSSASGSS
jgi:protein phosphatase